MSIHQPDLRNVTPEQWVMHIEDMVRYSDRDGDEAVLHELAMIGYRALHQDYKLTKPECDSLDQIATAVLERVEDDRPEPDLFAQLPHPWGYETRNESEGNQ